MRLRGEPGEASASRERDTGRDRAHKSLIIRTITVTETLESISICHFLLYFSVVRFTTKSSKHVWVCGRYVLCAVPPPRRIRSARPRLGRSREPSSSGPHTTAPLRLGLRLGWHRRHPAVRPTCGGPAHREHASKPSLPPRPRRSNVARLRLVRTSCPEVAAEEIAAAAGRV